MLLKLCLIVYVCTYVTYLCTNMHVVYRCMHCLFACLVPGGRDSPSPFRSFVVVTGTELWSSLSLTGICEYILGNVLMASYNISVCMPCNLHFWVCCVLASICWGGWSVPLLVSLCVTHWKTTNSDVTSVTQPHLTLHICHCAGCACSAAHTSEVTYCTTLREWLCEVLLTMATTAYILVTS